MCGSANCTLQTLEFVIYRVQLIPPSEIDTDIIQEIFLGQPSDSVG